MLSDFAENPGLYLSWDDGGKITRHLSDRMCVVAGPTFGVVTSINTVEGEIPRMLDEVRELIAAGVKTDWYLGPSTRPARLAEELIALGLRVPEDGSEMLDALLLDDEPDGMPTDVETYEVATMSDFTDAAEVRWEAFGMPDEEREHSRGFLAAYYEEHLRTRNRSTVAFVARLDGRVAGSANALLSDRGLFLVGGATAPWARGRGVYRALVEARWRYAVERGTPALTVHAISTTSSPILRRVGFREICTIRHLEGTPT
jgi:GNAT superfamily N-acetyltransferase